MNMSPKIIPCIFDSYL